MDKPTCSIPGCGRNAASCGWCGSHYNRFRRYGDPLAGPPIREAKLSPEEKRRRERERCRAYHAANRDRLNAARKARYDADPAAAMAATRRWVEENRDRWLAGQHDAAARRRARIAAAGYERVDREVVLAEHGRVCHICGQAIGDDLEFDHVVPIARGGSHTYENVRPSHRRCNRRKSKKLLDELTGAT